jgi:hypothetical protein
MADELDQALESRLTELINEPKRVDGDQGSYHNQSISDLIKLDEYMRKRRSSANPLAAFRSLMYRIQSPDGPNSTS